MSVAALCCFGHDIYSPVLIDMYLKLFRSLLCQQFDLFESIDVSFTKLQMASHIVEMVILHAVCNMEVALGRLTNGPNHNLMRFLCIAVSGPVSPLIEALAHPYRSAINVGFCRIGLM